MSGSFLPTRVLTVCLLCGLPAVPALAWNQPPVADIDNSVTPYLKGVSMGASVTLDGSDSYDPDGDNIITYRWKIYKWNGYGYSYQRTVTGEITSTSFSELGRYQIALDVEDEHHAWSQASDSCYVYVLTTSLTTSANYVRVSEADEDLVEIQASVTPTDIGGTARLGKSLSGTGNVDVYRMVGGNLQLLSLPWDWSLSHGPVPTGLYARGTADSSSAGDVGLSISFVTSSQVLKSSSQSVTAVEMRIDPPSQDFSGFIPVNDDDDNANGIRDKDGGALSQDDDDLIEFTLIGRPKSGTQDKVQLKIAGLPPDAVRSIAVWKDKKRTEQILPYGGAYTRDWGVGESVPSKIYVEGLYGTTGIWDYLAGDPRLYWTYMEYKNGAWYAQGSWPEGQEYEWLSVLHVDMDMHGVRDALEGDDNVTEEITPGGLVPMGDLTELYISPAKGTTDPCVGLVLNATPSNRIRVWKDQAKTQPVTFGQIVYRNGDLNGLTRSVWVEGLQVSSSSADVTLTMQPKFGSDPAMSEPYIDKIKLTVFNPAQKIPLGGSASLSAFAIGKVYVPTRYGGDLTLSGASVTLYYTDGSDLTSDTARQILRGDLDASIVASGNPCDFNAPEDAFRWFYIKTTSATPTSILSSFVESGRASTQPWNGWYWPRLDAAGSNLYEPNGLYTPLKDYDIVYGTNNRVLEWNNFGDYPGCPGWSGHCWGWTLAAIAKSAQPGATTKNGVNFNRDEMKGLYTELGDGATSGWTWRVGSPSSIIPAGPPTPALGEPIDSWAAEFHNGLRQYIRQQRKAMNADLRANPRDPNDPNDPNQIWNHPVYAYDSVMVEAPGGNERVVEITTTMASGIDGPEMPPDSASRSDSYVYVLEYNDNGDPNGSSTSQNWKMATAYAPSCMGTVGSLSWAPHHCSITKANVDSLYNP